MTKRFTSMYNEQSDMIQYVDTLKEEPNKWSICSVSETLKKLNELDEDNQKKDKVITHLMRIIYSHEPHIFAKAVEKNVKEMLE